MRYPKEILPNCRCKKIVNDLSGYSLSRTFLPEVGVEIIDKSTGFIHDIYVSNPTKRIVVLSMNLMGIFSPECNKIDILNHSFNEECAPNMVVNAPKYLIDFNVNESKRFWHLLIDYEKFEEITFLFNDESYQPAKCAILHAPTKGNFWHFTLNWYQPPDFQTFLEANSISKSNWQRRLANAAKSHLIKNAKLHDDKTQYKILAKSAFKMSRWHYLKLKFLGK